MKTLMAGILLLAPLAAVAGEIFGSITEREKAVPEGIKIEITAPNKATYSTATDKFGSYRIFVKEKGKCSITVHYKEQSISADVFSYMKSLRYDWVIDTTGGKYFLGRK